MNARKKKIVHLLCFFCLFYMLFFVSCTYNKEFAYLNDQIVAINKRITKLQDSVDTKLQSNLDSRFGNIQTNQANTGAELDNIKITIQEFSGRIEENEHLIKRTVEADLSAQDAIRKDLALLTEKVRELEQAIKNQQAALAAKKEEAGKEIKSQELELYDFSMALFKENKYEEAAASFQRFLDRYPKSDRADNAQFWIGESLMGQKQYEQAILAYQRVIEGYPQGNKIPSAILRQALAFSEINDRTSAKALLRKVIREFPNSEEAKTAQEKLNKME